MLALLAVPVAMTGCSSVGGNPGDGCNYGGQLRAPGTSFPSTDGCNSCSCDAQGQVACTLVDCVPSCTYDGGTYPAGAQFGPCDTCTCNDDGSVACKLIACVGDGGLPPFDGGAPVCTYNGTTYAAGSSFPSSDGCNSCGCGSGGEVSCTERGCANLCALDATYTFGPNGGLVAYIDSATLTPPGSYRYTRTAAGSGIAAPVPAAMTCAPAMPACRTDGEIDVADIMADLGAADVQLALSAAQPPLYGGDSRPVDGQVFEVKRSSGGSFLVGNDCPPTSSSCRPIPAGVAKLVADLRALNEQQLADPSCGILR